jgi:hypothetical protein
MIAIGKNGFLEERRIIFPNMPNSGGLPTRRYAWDALIWSD